MIQDKIQGRLTGGPAGLRRAFQFFDSDGSGAISHDEFKEAIRLKCMLVLEDHILEQVMARFDPGNEGEISRRTRHETVILLTAPLHRY